MKSLNSATAILLFAALPVSPSPGAWFNGFFLEQDALVDSNEDRNYTQGLGLMFGGKEYEKSALARVPFIVDSFTGLDQLHEAWFPTGYRHSMMLSQGAYTPDDLSSSEPIFDDRPYSSLLALSWNRSSIHEVKRRALTTQVTLGILGIDNLAEDVQSAIHQTLRSWSGDDTPVDPEGWDHQISAGGELTAMYQVSLLKELSSYPRSGAKDHEAKYLDISGNLGVGAGYYTMANAGLQMRAGLINSAYYAHTLNPGSVVDKGADSARGATWEAYLFYRATGYAVGYNANLQGQFRDSDHELDYSDVEPFFNEHQWGGTLRIKSFRASYAISERSAEHKLAQARVHQWGGIYLNWNIEF